MTVPPAIGFIGLGDQGEPMAHGIAAAGWPLHLWARRRESLAPFARTSASIAESPRELAQRIDILCFCTFAEADLSDLLFREPDGAVHGLSAGKLVVIHNTIAPEACRRIAARLAAIGVDTLDAPVAGGREKAFARQLAVMVGGDRAVFDRCAVLFGSYGDPVIHLGPIGSGQAAKIVNNALMICTMQLADTAFAIAGELGLSVSAVQDLLTRASAASFSMNLLVAHDRGTRQAHAAGPGIIRKDIALFREICGGAGVAMRELDELGATAAARAPDLLRVR